MTIFWPSPEIITISDNQCSHKISTSTKMLPEFCSVSAETFQPESGKIAGKGTFYVRRERKRERAAAAATIFEKCPPQHTVNLKRATEWNRRDILT